MNIRRLTLVALLAAGCSVSVAEPAPAPTPPPAFDATVIAAYVDATFEVQNTASECQSDEEEPYMRSVPPEVTSRLRQALLGAGFRVVTDPAQKHQLVVKPSVIWDRCGYGVDTTIYGRIEVDFVVDGAVADQRSENVDFDETTMIASACSDIISSAQRSSSLARALTQTAPQLARSPAPDEKPRALAKEVRMAVFPLRPKGTASATVCDLLTNYMLSRLDAVQNLKTIGRDDIEATLGLERQKEAMGCDTLTCFAEIGGALNVDVILFGEIGPVGSRYAVNLSVVRARDSSVLGRVSAMPEQNEDALVTSVPGLVEGILTKLEAAQ